jgi:hypothetical protein
VLESPTKYYLAIRVASKQSKEGGKWIYSYTQN